MKSDIVDVTVIMRLDDPSKQAIAVWDGVSYLPGTIKEKWEWLPRSMIEWERVRGAIRGGTIEVSLPEWLAKEKGLI